VNDNAPSFDAKTLTVPFLEDSKPDTEVESLIAFDEDEGINAQIEYSIINDEGSESFLPHVCETLFRLFCSFKR